MSYETEVLDLFAAANPVPDDQAMDISELEPAAYLTTLETRSSTVTKLDERADVQETKRTQGWLIAVAAIAILVVGTTIFLLTRGDGEPPVVTNPPDTTVPGVVPDAAGLMIELEFLENVPEGTEIAGAFRASGSMTEAGDFCERGVFTETAFQEGSTPGSEMFEMRFECTNGSITIAADSTGREEGLIWLAENTWVVVDSTGSMSGAIGEGTGTTECDNQLCALTFEGEIEIGDLSGESQDSSVPTLTAGANIPGDYSSTSTFASPFTVTLPEGWRVPVAEDATIHFAPTATENRVAKVEIVPDTPEALIDLFASNESISATEPELRTIAGLDASYVRLTATEQAMTLLPGWTNDVYFVEIAGEPMVLVIQAADEVFADFEPEAVALFETIVWRNQG